MNSCKHCMVTGAFVCLKKETQEKLVVQLKEALFYKKNMYFLLLVGLLSKMKAVYLRCSVISHSCDCELVFCLSVMAGLSNYALRMARLSAHIFGEVVRPTDSKSMKVVKLFQEPPLAKRKEVYDWYPQHKIYYAMTQKLRFMGLFRYCKNYPVMLMQVSCD